MEPLGAPLIDPGGGGLLVFMREAYLELPPVTRTYITICVGVALAVYVDLITPLQLYFSPLLIWKHGQVWRLLTSFFFFGQFGFSFLLNMVFTYRYCRLLEEESFRRRTADFITMFVFGFALTIVFAYLFFDLLFLGQAFTIMLVYIWARRNPHVPMSFFGLITFNAPYLPWFLVAFSILMGNSVTADLLGIAVGHVYYFLEDVFPRQHDGLKLIRTPDLLKWICGDEMHGQGRVFAPPVAAADADADAAAAAADPAHGDGNDAVIGGGGLERPGGYDWGVREAQRQPSSSAGVSAVVASQPSERPSSEDGDSSSSNGGELRRRAVDRGGGDRCDPPLD